MSAHLHSWAAYPVASPGHTNFRQHAACTICGFATPKAILVQARILTQEQADNLPPYVRHQAQATR